MCNLYSETKGQAAIRALFSTAHDRTGNLQAFPGIFPDQLAPIVRNSVEGERELVMARWGMPGPPQFGGQPVTNIRNVSSPSAILIGNRSAAGANGKWRRAAKSPVGENSFDTARTAMRSNVQRG